MFHAPEEEEEEEDSVKRSPLFDIPVSTCVCSMCVCECKGGKSITPKGP